MTAALPRVTYSNIAADFTPLHDWLDGALPKFRADMLGRAWPNIVGNRQNVSGTSYEVRSPIDRDLLVARLVAGDDKAVGEAVAAARAAYPAWSGRPWQERVALMRRWAEEIDKRKYDLGMASMFEVGKSRLEAIGEAEEAVDLVAWYADEMERNEGFTQQMRRAVPEEETVCRLRPVGVFAVIAPFNFAVALPCNMLGACLVAGNTAVFKPSPGAGLTGSLLMEAAVAAGLPRASSTSSAARRPGRCWWRRTASTASPSPAPTKSECRSCARWRASRSCGRSSAKWAARTRRM
jgi:1-pyrroline-5-carboxylate dehydrogenase